MPKLPDGTEYLVGYLHRTGSLATVKLDTALESNRFHMVAWHFDSGPPILIGNVYGHAAPNGTQQTALNATVQAFLDHCESHKAPLAALLGDFNMEQHQIHSGVWLDACGWRDCSDQGTCLASIPPGDLTG